MARLLNSTHEPWVLRSIGPYADLKSKLVSIAPPMRIFELDGDRMRTIKAFYDEFTKKFEFPDYFGRNLNALDECITDLDWLGEHSPTVVVVRDANFVSMNDYDAIEILVRRLTIAGAEWADPNTEGADWDRRPVPFHSILHFESTETVCSGASSLPMLEP